MKIMLVGDVCGRPGREAFARITPALRKEKNIDVVIVNGENSAGGKGFTRKSFEALRRGGADVVTSGNHVWDKREVLEFIDDEPFLLRPANYPHHAPGRGWCLYPWRAKSIAVMNLSGRVFMPTLDCPFQTAERLLREIGDKADVVILDFHAEATSEKMAMGWHMDGRAQIVVGTHTHVQTADERILTNGTAYITDLGMTGPMDSVLGVRKSRILERFLTGRPTRFDLAEGPCVYSALIVEIDEKTNRPTSLERVLRWGV